MRRQIRAKPGSALVRFDWGSPIVNIQIPNQRHHQLSQNSVLSPIQAYLVSSKGFLLVRRAQRDGGYDCASARIWVRPDVDGTSTKAIQFHLVALLRGIEVSGAVDGGSQCDWCHGI